MANAGTLRLADGRELSLTLTTRHYIHLQEHYGFTLADVAASLANIVDASKIPLLDAVIKTVLRVEGIVADDAAACELLDTLPVGYRIDAAAGAVLASFLPPVSASAEKNGGDASPLAPITDADGDQPD